jgi:prepilin-type N-terminal cleavage/methylation domain-containing protein
MTNNNIIMRLVLRPAKSLQNRGFTLIEVLVVLILFGMIGSILFQALERAYHLQDRFGTELFSVQQGQMATDWYRQTVQGLYPEYPAGPNLFRGNAQEFSGLSTNPLNSDPGAPTSITWQIRNNLQNGTIELIYIEGKQESPILNWQSKGARFIYLDEKLAAQEVWPPPLGLTNQLPTQIQLEIKGAGTLIASPMGPTQLLPRLQDL